MSDTDDDTTKRPTDTELLAYAFRDKPTLFRIAAHWNWNAGNLDLIRAAISLDMRQKGRAHARQTPDEAATVRALWTGTEPPSESPAHHEDVRR